MTTKKYGIMKGNNSSVEYDTYIQQIVGEYDSYEEALKQIPAGWVADPDTNADQYGELWYAPGTDEAEMDGYNVLLAIIAIYREDFIAIYREDFMAIYRED